MAVSLFGPALVDDAVLEALETLCAARPAASAPQPGADPDLRRRLPGMPQVACFDTAFHRSQPEIAQMFALPREMRERGVALRLSRPFLRLHRIGSEITIPTRVGPRRRRPSRQRREPVCALEGGVSVATTMGFSALDGLPMGTRCGALDPAVVFYMLREMKLSPEAERMLYTKSGLLEVSGLSNDMRILRSKAAGTRTRSAPSICSSTASRARSDP